MKEEEIEELNRRSRSISRWMRRRKRFMKREIMRRRRRRRKQKSRECR